MAIVLQWFCDAGRKRGTTCGSLRLQDVEVCAFVCVHVRRGRGDLLSGVLQMPSCSCLEGVLAWSLLHGEAALHQDSPLGCSGLSRDHAWKAKPSLGKWPLVVLRLSWLALWSCKMIFQNAMCQIYTATISCQLSAFIILRSSAECPKSFQTTEASMA